MMLSWIDEVAAFDRFQVTLDSVYSWSSQVVQYKDCPPPEQTGFAYFSGPTPQGNVDCLLWWIVEEGKRPRIAGILNHYPQDFTLEKKGNVNIWVRKPDQHKGIGTVLFSLADVMFGPLDLDQQRFTRDGAALARHLVEDRARRLAEWRSDD